MALYRHYTGSTATHDAHTASLPGHVARSIDAIGVWEGLQENVRITVSRWPSDARATRHAQTLARDTGNDVILVVRQASPIDDRRYRVTRSLLTGPRIHATIEPGMEPYTFRADIDGEYTAWLVDEVGLITPINA